MSKRRARGHSAFASAAPSLAAHAPPPSQFARVGFFHRIPVVVRFCVGALFLCISGLAAYSQTLENGWTWDDNQQIAMNPDLRQDAPLSRAFAGDVWSFQHPGTHGDINYFRPMQTLTYRLTSSLFGLRPEAFHSVSLGFHLLATVLGFGLFWVLTGRLLGAFAAAALFAVNPIHTEAVDWCSALPDLGCTIFFSLAFLLFCIARKPDALPPSRPLARSWRISCWVLSALAFFAALLWKETAIVFPLVIVAWSVLLAEFSGLRARILGALNLSAPYWGVLAGYLLLRVRLLGFLATRQQDWNLGPLSFVLSVMDLLRTYWWKLLVPFPLNAYYVFHPVRGLGDPRALLAVVFVIAAAAGIWFSARRAPLIAFSALWVFLTLLPVLNIYGIGRNPFTERYLYLPSLGFCPLVVMLASRGAGWSPPSVRKPAAVVALVSVFFLFMGITARRTPDWKDDATLFSRTLQTSPQAPFVHFMVASLQDNSESGQRSAEEHYLRAVELAGRESPPDYLNMVLSYEGLSSIYSARGQFGRALDALQQVRRIAPDDPEVDSAEGFVLEQAGRWAEAEGFLRKAESRSPLDPNVLNALGLLSWQYYHHLDQAASYFSRAIAAHPVDDDFSASLHNNLGAVYAIQGKSSAAIEQFQRATSIAPSDPEFRTHLAAALAMAGRVDQARSELLTTLAIAPDYLPARQALQRLQAP